MKNYEFLEHTADIKFRSFGKTLPEAFSNAALALGSIMSQQTNITPKIKEIVEVTGEDYESLLYNFLEEFLFLFDSKGFILSKINKINLSEKTLKAEVLGDKAENYNFSNPVKAITYNEMFVKKINNSWVCQVVLDV